MTRQMLLAVPPATAAGWSDEPAVMLLHASYRTAGVEVRGRLAVTPDALPLLLSRMAHAVPGVVVLSTCNRLEVYVSGTHDSDAMIGLFARLAGIDADLAASELRTKHGVAAVRHLHAVAAGVDSMVLGEPQILGQATAALRAAEQAGAADEELKRLFHSAIRTGRRVRATTSIAERAVSVPTVAAREARRLHGDLQSATVLIGGSGEAGRLAAEALASYGVRDLVFANRTLERAEALAAAIGGRAVPLSRLDEEVAHADVLIAASAGPGPIVEAAQIGRTLDSRQDRGMVIIDLAVPRCVDPGVRDLPGVLYRDMDDLARIARANQSLRASEVERVVPLIEEGVDSHLSWWREWRAAPVIARIAAGAEEMRQAELAKTVRRMQPSGADMERLDALTRAIVKQLLHPVIAALRTGASQSDPTPLEAVGTLFDLDGREPTGALALLDDDAGVVVSSVRRRDESACLDCCDFAGEDASLAFDRSAQTTARRHELAPSNEAALALGGHSELTPGHLGVTADEGAEPLFDRYTQLMPAPYEVAPIAGAVLAFGGHAQLTPGREFAAGGDAEMGFDGHVHLTPREREVAALLLEGLTIAGIARRLGRSTETVRVHVRHQHLKTQTRNLHSLALWAQGHRLCCVRDRSIQVGHEDGHQKHGADGNVWRLVAHGGLGVVSREVAEIRNRP